MSLHPYVGACVDTASIVSNVYARRRILIQNLLYQGFLDLHGWLYSPNGGVLIGHLPVNNFLDFVHRVTYGMINESGCAVQDKLPYKLDLELEPETPPTQVAKLGPSPIGTKLADFV